MRIRERSASKPTARLLLNWPRHSPITLGGRSTRTTGLGNSAFNMLAGICISVFKLSSERQLFWVVRSKPKRPNGRKAAMLVDDSNGAGVDVALFTFAGPQSAWHLTRDFLQEPVAGSKTAAESLHEALKALIALEPRRLLRVVW